MRTALDIVRDLVREEKTLAQRLEVVRAQLGALKRLAAGGVQTSASRPARAGTRSSSSRPPGRKHARARRAPGPAPLAKEARVKVVAQVARGAAIREVLAKARVEAATVAPPPPPAPTAPPTPPVAKTTHRQRVAARHEQLHHIPTAARAYKAEGWYRCRCAGDAQLGQANNQAQAKLACGALVFGKKLRVHLAEHDLAVATDQAALEYFSVVDPNQGREG